MEERLNRLFHLKENNTNVRTECLAGLTTFMTMAYILAVNPSILGTTGMNPSGVFAATAIGAALGSILMAIFANYPFALAPGMGLNAFFAFSVCGAMGYSWQVALAAVFVEGLIFIILSITPVREMLFNSIPMSLKMGIGAGIGFFIAFIGLQGGKLVVDAPTLVSVYPFRESLADGTFYSVGIGALLCLVGTLSITIFNHLHIRGDILLGIFFTWFLAIICELAGVYIPNHDLGAFSTIPDLSKEFTMPNLGAVAMQMDFSMLLTLNFLTIVLSFMFVDIFDTLGTLIGVASKADMLDKDGKLPRIKGALLSDALATLCGSMLGTSTVSTYVESSSGVGVGGRTGLTAIVVAILFLLSLFLAPIFLTAPSFAVAPALIYVGYLMLGSILKIDYSDITEAFPAYITIIVMAFTYSISEGICIGIISYVLINLFSGAYKNKNISFVMYFLAVIFFLKYIFL